MRTLGERWDTRVGTSLKRQLTLITFSLLSRLQQLKSVPVVALDLHTMAVLRSTVASAVGLTQV